MTTSQQPWSIELIPSLGVTATRLKDSSGNVIALFNRYEDAEHILNILSEYVILKDDESALIKDLENKIEEWKECAKQYRDCIESAKTVLTEI